MEYSAFRFCLAASSWDKIRELEGRKGGSRSSSSEGGVKGDGLLRDKERQGTCWGRRGGWCLSSHTVDINLPSALWNKEREMLPGWLWTQTHSSTKSIKHWCLRNSSPINENGHHLPTCSKPVWLSLCGTPMYWCSLFSQFQWTRTAAYWAKAP